MDIINTICTVIGTITAVFSFILALIRKSDGCQNNKTAIYYGDIYYGDTYNVTYNYPYDFKNNMLFKMIFVFLMTWIVLYNINYMNIVLSILMCVSTILIVISSLLTYFKKLPFIHVVTCFALSVAIQTPTFLIRKPISVSELSDKILGQSFIENMFSISSYEILYYFSIALGFLMIVMCIIFNVVNMITYFLKKQYPYKTVKWIILISVIASVFASGAMATCFQWLFTVFGVNL